MAPIPVRFSDLEFFNFAFWSISVAHASEMPCVLSTICLHMNLRAQEASNFNLFRRGMTSQRHTQSTVNVVVVSRKRCQIASLLLHNINGKRYMTYRIESISMTLSHFQGHSYCKSFKYDFSYSCALTGFQLTQRVARPLCGSGASCVYR